jgi:hypothetical protein
MKDVIAFWLSILLAALVMFLITGCASKVEYVDRVVKVNVPVRCIAPDVSKSVQGRNDAESLLGIIRERDELRKAIEVCR